MQRKESSNTSRVTEFLLLNFSDIHELQMLLFGFFLLIYLIALIENLLLITIVVLDCQLHKPMYIFLANLSILDICFISITVPKSMNISLTQIRSISFSGCMVQIFLGLTFAVVEFTLLAVMAYDRYIAICYPLHYQLLMSKIKCFCMVAVCWVSSIIYSTLHTLNIIFLPFCGPNNIDQIFCEITHTLKLVCANTYGNEMAVFMCGIIFGIIFSSSVIASYVRIFLTIKKIPSAQGKHKAFSTCFPHLAVFSLFMSTGLLTYLKTSSESSIKEILASLLYSVVSPIANPLIYSLRNKEIKAALEKLISTIFYYRKIF
ncbi:olfactory receptor 1G1-like [Vipera latastei]